uniref:RING-type E3 ubiquitin transferase n=1 Tax=Tanacetum cinerariifolium TaxID=118510 RepID=A0A6L2NPT4_TANCI|nr:E3 ubiquitin-protein ligase MBR2-like isoform X1 [Tanacetum cinerariifolium]
MDLFSSKRDGGWISSLRKGPSLATRDIAGSRDEAPQLCTRIGCSGRLHHTRISYSESPRSVRPSSRSSSTKEAVNHVKKPTQESIRKLSSKIETGSTSSGSVSGESERKLKSKSRNDDSKKSVLKTGNTKVRTVSGQRHGLANQDSQIGSLDSERRTNAAKKRSNGGETSLPARGKKISGPSSDTRSSSSGPRHSRNLTQSADSSSVRTQRPVNVHRNNPSPAQSTRVTPDNVDAIANVLLALERIDQDEGLTFEQIMLLEGNSFLGGLNLYDQHRDMRLDIDNMSYEELLALEDEIGIVNTALSEEELSKCVRMSVYKPLDTKGPGMRDDWCMDNTKCSICQEEFIAGDEIGRVGCDHGYHAECIDQWLRLKNWCPICKVSAKPSESS